MLDFQRIHLFQKRPWRRAISLLDQIVEISLLSQIIRFQVNAPFGDFLTVITNFFGSLKSKGRWLFMNNKSSVKIFWFQALWKPRFENKRNFWINCVCTKAFHNMTYIHEHLHHGIPTRGHLRHDIHTWTFTSWHTCMSICIMTCPLESICTTRHFASSSLQGDICITGKYVRWRHHE